MHHWKVHTKVEFHKFPPDVRSRGIHSTTFDPELRNEFKNFSNSGGSIPQLLILTSEMNLKFFSNPGESIPQLLILNSEMNLKNFPILGGSIPQLLILNSEFKFFSIGGVHSTTFDPELRNEFKNFSKPGRSIPQLLILNSEINLKIFPILEGCLSTDPHTPY